LSVLKYSTGGSTVALIEHCSGEAAASLTDAWS